MSDLPGHGNFFYTSPYSNTIYWIFLILPECLKIVTI